MYSFHPWCLWIPSTKGRRLGLRRLWLPFCAADHGVSCALPLFLYLPKPWKGRPRPNVANSPRSLLPATKTRPPLDERPIPNLVLAYSLFSGPFCRPLAFFFIRFSSRTWQMAGSARPPTVLFIYGGPCKSQKIHDEIRNPATWAPQRNTLSGQDGQPLRLTRTSTRDSRPRSRREGA